MLQSPLSPILKPSFAQIAALGQSYRRHPRYEGIIGHWLMVDGGGTKVRDISGNNNHGTMTSMDPATDWVIGQFGPALDLDGSNDHVSVADDNTLTPNHITISAWVKFDVTDVLQGIVSKRVGFANNDEYNLFFWPSAPDGTGIYSRINGSTTAGTYAFYINTPSTSEWLHVASVYNRSTIQIYVNGLPVGTAGSLSSAITNGTASLNMGVLNVGSSPFNGLIDEVRIYGRAFSAAEIWSLKADPDLEFRPRRRAWKAPAAADATRTPLVGSAILSGISGRMDLGIRVPTEV